MDPEKSDRKRSACSGRRMDAVDGTASGRTGRELGAAGRSIRTAAIFADPAVLTPMAYQGSRSGDDSGAEGVPDRD
ncbi:hypothetical protein [Xanthomonas arboricola]|uniref:hypothetical protein n=1 Tax=Xanthomonas arboricola TaxID=56448 RepID=UPI0015E4033E|nr:hypothetical protein [Xanthomonas arboricola]